MIVYLMICISKDYIEPKEGISIDNKHIKGYSTLLSMKNIDENPQDSI